MGLGTNARKLNMSGAFMVPEAQEIKVRGRSVLQIDDVHTSGADRQGSVRRVVARRRVKG